MSDELIYRVKLELDQKSREDLENQLKQLESSARKSSGGKSGDGGAEKEVSVLKELKQQLASYREELAKVNQQASQNATTDDALRDAQIQLGSAIRGTSAQIQEANRGYGDLNSVINSIPQTYNELVEQNRALSLAMRKVPLNDTTGQLDKLKKQYGENNAKLKEFDGSIGNFQRNVGDYENSLRSFANSIAVIQGPLGPLAGRINSLATVLSRYKEMTNSATVATTRFGKALIALQGTPIVTIIAALAIALSSVIRFFRGSEEGQNAFAVRMAKIGAVTSLVKDVFADFGKFLVSVFTFNLTEAGKALGDMGDTLARFLNIGDEIDLAAQTQESLNQVKILEREIGVIRAANKRDLQEARDIARDETRSVQERRDALSEVRKAEEQRLEVERRLAFERLKAVEAQVAQFKSTDADFENLAKARQQYFEVEQEAFEVSMRLRRDDNALMRKGLEQELALSRSAFNAKMTMRQADLDAALSAMEMEFNKRGALELKLAVIGEDRMDRVERREKDFLKLMIDPVTARKQAEQEVDAEIYAERRQALTEIAQFNQGITDKMLNYDRQAQRISNEMLFNDTINGYRESYDKIGEIKFRLMNVSANREIDIEERILALRKEGFSEELAERYAVQEVDQQIQANRIALQSELNQARVDQMNTIRQMEFDLAQSLGEQERRELYRRNELTKGIVVAAREDLRLLEENMLRTREERIAQLTLQYTQTTGDARIAAEMATNQVILDDRQQLADKSAELVDLQAQGHINTMKVVADALGAFNQAFFNDSKALAVAQTIINTYAAAIGAFKDTPGPVWVRSLAAAAATATGIANVKKILATNLNNKSISQSSSNEPNIGTSFGLVDVGTNAPIAEQVAGMAGVSRQNMNPTFVFQGDLDPEIMSIKVTEGSNAISSRTLGVGI